MLQIFTFVATQLYRYGRDLLFIFSSSSVCVHGLGSFCQWEGHGTWDMVGLDLTGVCLARFPFFLSFFGIHGKGPGGLGWVVGSSHFLYFSGTHVW